MIDSAYFLSAEQIARGGMPSVFHKARACQGSTTSIANELHLFNYTAKKTNKEILRGTESIIGEGIHWEYSDSTVLVDTVVVQDVSGTTTYIRDLDYLINEEGVLERLPNAGIEDNSIVRVSYDYFETCIDSKTGTPRITCSTCLGTGVIYDEGIPIIGLLHIPSIDDKLVKSGVLRLGEAVYTTSNHIDITTNFDDTTNYWVRDKLVIDKVVYINGAWIKKPQEWIVIKPPSPININSTYLANRLFIKLKDQQDSRPF